MGTESADFDGMLLGGEAFGRGAVLDGTFDGVVVELGGGPAGGAEQKLPRAGMSGAVSIR